MATFQTYACGNCGLSSRISPGNSAIRAGSIRTGYCVHCEDFHAPLIEEGESLLPRALSTEQRRKFVCETHFSTPLVAWFKGNPCPRCGGKLMQDPNGIGFCAD